MRTNVVTQSAVLLSPFETFQHSRSQ